jgi:hypothetical protein
LAHDGCSPAPTFTVNPPSAPTPTLSTLTLNRSSVVGGTSAVGTVTLSAAAPTGGATVTLASSNASLASVPASVVVPAGAMSASFTVTTFATKKNGFATIAATYAGVT